jgi:flavin-dependent dehydrogenase
MADVNLREMFRTFCDLYEPARRLVEGGEMLGELKGAPLRCSLEGATLSRAGLLVTGEAAGSTYAFTGEGIGKAMETGLLAAEALLPSLQVAGNDVSAAADTAARAQYASSIDALRPRFALYERANRVNDHPWIADLLIWRGRKSERIMNRMKAVLEETGNPGNLVSVRGIVRLFVPIA